MSTINKSELIKQINTTIDNIRPYLQSDGGDIEFVEITDDLVIKVKLIGACETCPFSFHTLKAGVEIALRKEIPELKEVIAV
jgi:Fe-S cluster biogenesis protein NfuA